MNPLGYPAHHPLAMLYASTISPGGFFPGPLAPPPPACMVSIAFLVSLVKMRRMLCNLIPYTEQCKQENYMLYYQRIAVYNDLLFSIKKQSSSAYVWHCLMCTVWVSDNWMKKLRTWCQCYSETQECWKWTKFNIFGTSKKSWRFKYVLKFFLLAYS